MPYLGVLRLGVYGGWAFLHHQIWMYLFLVTEFAFYDDRRSAVLFVLDHIAMMGLFILTAYVLSQLLRRKQHSEGIQ